ncbi:MAG: hypothetical protein FWD87_01195 [Spirochaetaceae bacterium]|nr:hypothetical protein [Spirochaetaceae bacterium]
MYKKSISLFVLVLYIFSLFPAASLFAMEEEYKPFVYVLESEAQLIKASEGGVIKLRGASIEIPAGALDKDKEVTIKRLLRTNEIGGDLQNVTQGGGGYRFLPAGTKFNKEVVIRISYDSQLPEAAVNNLRTYFFNKQEGQWIALERIDIDRISHEVVSVTTHFTDMINATLTLPESASPLRFDINSIKNLEAANPGSGIMKLEGLAGGRSGNANFKMELNIPSGRRGLFPELAVTYSSDGNVGVMGKGFDLFAGSRISTDTRWGLPEYDGSDDYLLDGVRLRLERSTGAVDEYRPEREVGYERIERHKGLNDHWVVTDRRGSKRIYGRSNNLNSWSGASANRKYTWYLEQEEDVYGNTIIYKYERENNYVYLKEINYTGTGSEEGAYRIIFFYKGGREDQRIDGRGGYLSVLTKFLDKINVQYRDYVLRSYEFDYEKDLFHRVKQLVAFREVSPQGGLFYEYRFDYEKLLPNNRGVFEIFGPQEEWRLGSGLQVQQGVSSGFDGSGSVGAGIGIGTRKIDIRFGGGRRVSSSSGESQTIHTLVDINGDGLLDSVRRISGGFEVRLNTGSGFGPPIEITGLSLSGINVEESRNSSTGWNVYGGIGTSIGKPSAGISRATTNQRGTSESNTSFMDVDGDGLVDIVISGLNYYYKNVSTEDNIRFERADWFNAGGELIANAFEPLSIEEIAEYDRRFYQQTLFRGWKAIRPGVVEVSQRVEAVNESRLSSDGINAKSYKGSNAAPFSIKEIKRGGGSKENLGQELSLTEGEYLYFISNAGSDTLGDEILWNIRIRYKEKMPYVDMDKGVVFIPQEEITEADLFLPSRISGEAFAAIERVLKAVSNNDERNNFYDALFSYYIYDVNNDEYFVNTRNRRKVSGGDWRAIQDSVAELVSRCTPEERLKMLWYKWEDGAYYEVKSNGVRSYIEKIGETLAIDEADITGTRQNGLFVLDRIDGKEFLITPDYNTVYQDEVVYSQDATGVYTENTKSLLEIIVPVKYKGIEKYRKVYTFSGYEGISGVLKEEDLRNLQNILQTKDYSLENYQELTPEQLLEIEKTLTTTDFQLFLSYYDNYTQREDLTDEDKLVLKNLLEKLAWLDFLREVFPYYEEKDGKFYLKLEYEELLSHSSGMSLSMIVTKINNLEEEIINIAKEINELPETPMPELIAKKAELEEEKTKWENIKSLVSGNIKLGKDKWRFVSRRIIYFHNGLYSVVSEGERSYIQQLYLEDDNFVYKEKEIRTWDSGRDYGAIDLVKSPLSYEVFEEYEYKDEYGYMIHETSLVVVEMELEEQLYGGVNNWYYGVWLGSQQFSESLLREQKESALGLSQGDIEQRNADMENNPEAHTNQPVFMRPTANEHTALGEGLDSEEARLAGIILGEKQIEEDENTKNVWDGKFKKGPGLEKDFIIGQVSTVVRSRLVQSSGGELVPETQALRFAPYIIGDFIHTSRFGGSSYYEIDGIRAQQAGGTSSPGSPMTMVKVRRSSNENTETTTAANISVPLGNVSAVIGGFGGAVGGGGNHSENAGSSWMIQSFQDINGDGIPDIIQRNGDSIRVIPGSRDGFGRSYDLAGVSGYLNQNTNTTTGYGASLNAGTSISVDYSPTGRVRSANISGSSSSNYTSTNGSSNQSAGFIDINGDGLPDYVSGGIVRLNTGRNFYNSNHAYSVPVISRTENISRGLSIPLSVGSSASAGQANNTGIGFSLGGGISYSFSMATTTERLIDINGDGLPDRVIKDGNNFRVYLNLGNRFSETPIIIEARGWNLSREDEDFLRTKRDGTLLTSAITGLPIVGGVTNSLGLLNRVTELNDPFASSANYNVIEGSSSVSTGVNGSLNLDLNISIRIPIPLVRLFLNITAISGGAGINGGANLGGVTVEMMDIDGDGLVDRIIRISGSNRIYVQRNITGKVGLLNKITLPQGGEYRLYYERKGNTIHMPRSMYVLSKVVMHDGCGLDGRVRLNHSSFHEYAVKYEYFDPYYDRGEKEFYGFGKVMAIFPDDQRKVTYYAMPFNKGANREKVSSSYYKRGMVTERRVYSGDKRLFAQVIYTLDVSPHARIIREESRQFDIENRNEELVRRVGYNYDNFGNITRIINEWQDSSGKEKRLRANIEYGFNNFNRYLHSHPTKIEVFDTNNNLLRRRTGAYNHNTGSLIRLSQFDGLQEEESILTWDNFGNLRSIREPGGATVSYEYDTTLNQYVTAIRVSSSGTDEYISRIEWDIRYGRKIMEQDENDNRIRYRYDNFGRLHEIFSPYDNYPHGTPSVKYTYHIKKGTLWHAITENKVLFDSNNNDVIKTVIITDHIGRLYLTAKTGLKREASGFDRDGWNISGSVTYDHKWRIIEEGQNQFVAGDIDALLSIAPLVSMLRPIQKEYDSLDRVVRITLPDGARQSMKYGIQGDISFVEVTDPLGNLTREERDSCANVARVLRYEQDKRRLLTSASYIYDELGQMLIAKDHKGNPLQITYDLMGRMKSIESSDIGRKEYKYDNRGNLVEESNSVLRSRGSVIRYEYDGLNRLARIVFPQSRAVTYEYGGNRHRNINAANRVVRVTDESGFTEYEYGKLGEVVKETRMIELLTPGISLPFQVMQYRSDYLGRMQEIIYPDGEQVRYIYDRGGQIKSVKGYKFAGREVYYIRDIAYDEFGNRKFIEYGNGVKTWYEYDENRRWLSTIKTRGNNIELQNISYTFDFVGNVLGYDNMARRYDTSQRYEYDNLYQLIRAEGTHRHRPVENMHRYQIATYSQAFSFDAIGNMTRKESKSGLNFGSALGDNLNYANDYEYYEGYSHRLKRAGNMFYVYDFNGNLILEREGGLPPVNERDMPYHQVRENVFGARYGFAIGDIDGARPQDNRPYERRFRWNERNMMIASEDPRVSVKYVYGHDGQRTNKQVLGGGESIYFNSMWNIRYIPAYNERFRESKHIFVGQNRLVTKNSDIGSKLTGNHSNDEVSTYYYHSDHLGSAQLITDFRGNEYERLEYTPYGELWINHHRFWAIDTMPYRFTGKELDAETGFYYFGARYLDPRISRWISADPAIGEYIPRAPINDEARRHNQNLPGVGGIFNYINFHVYHYGANNPVKYIDPDGRVINLAAGGIGLAFGAVTGAAVAYTAGKSIREVMAAAAGGAVMGGMTGVTMGASLAAGLAAGALAGVAGYTAENIVNWEPNTAAGIVESTMGGVSDKMLGDVISMSSNAAKTYVNKSHKNHIQNTNTKKVAPLKVHFKYTKNKIGANERIIDAVAETLKEAVGIGQGIMNQPRSGTGASDNVIPSYRIPQILPLEER